MSKKQRLEHLTWDLEFQKLINKYRYGTGNPPHSIKGKKARNFFFTRQKDG